jgi:toxin HigB-1
MRQAKLVSLIENFKHRGLKRFFENDDPRGIRPDMAATVREILTVMDAAAGPKDLDLPGYRLHQLKGELRGLWSVAVNANWRIVFRFDEGNAHDVELADYH